MRIVLAAVAGGIVMFVWSAAAHLFLGVGEAGMKTIPNEAPVVAALKANISEPGLYFVPGVDMSRRPTDEEMAAWTAKYQAGPDAMIIYTPAGETPMSGRQLGIEFISNV